MTPASMIFLGFMTLVFFYWAAMMFRTLWRLTKRAYCQYENSGGGLFAWYGHSLRTFGAFLTSDKDRRERRHILLLTLIMLLTNVLWAFWFTRLS